MLFSPVFSVFFTSEQNFVLATQIKTLYGFNIMIIEDLTVVILPEKSEGL